ncbi:T9SS type A sorting domain-containing protein [Flavobacterium suncheonense]|uniref:T9SS type A sorting domain-containing protein n=1 Tax=Flavobacterium suncheonense TaxID=350894 RepID=UPI003FA35F17
MKKIYALLLTLTVSALSFGQVNYLNDSFNYPDNSLLTDNGWTSHSGGTTEAIDVGASNGLTYAGYNDGVASITGFTAGNAARVDNNGQDVNKVFSSAPANGSVIYTSFLLNVASASSAYFMHLSPSNTSTQVGRIWVKASSVDAANKFNIGASNGGTAVYGTSELNLNTTYLVIVKYDNNTGGALSLWVKASGIPATEAAAGTPEITTSGSGNGTIDRICLRQSIATQNTTVDALYISSSWLGTTPCNLALGTEVATCDAVTLAIDTYSVSIPFTGGNTGTYNLSANAGTIGGDNLNTTATGDITITNIPEGTSVTLTITGTCGLSKTVIAPECKPENALPYNEPFNYAPATVLTSTQMWSQLATGDDIVTTSGNLTYPGITSTGNSITFVGTGADARTPLVPVTSGTIYASFIVNVTDLSAVTDDIANTTTYTYFALFDQSASTFTSARLWHRRNGSQSQFGVSTAANPTTTVWSPNLHTPGTPVYLVLGYDFATQLVTLFENPTIGGNATPSVSATLAAPISTIGGFVLRQDSTNTTPNIIIDELRIAATPNFTLGTTSFNNISGLNVYPNPANDFLHITTAINGVKTIAVYDVMGKEVLNTTTANETINVSSLNAGIYMVKITEEGKTATRKLVIQ